MKERELMQATRKTARLLGWIEYHTYNSRKSTPGFPDWIALRGERMLVVEFKNETYKTTEDQDLWLAAFGQIPGIEVHLWRPSHWKDGTIEATLRAS